MVDEDTALVLDDRQTGLVVQRQRKALARTTAAAGFFGSFMTIGIAAAAMLLLAPITVPMAIVVPFCLVCGTAGGWWFGKEAGKKVIK